MPAHIQILGTGCPNCKKLAEVTEAAAQELGLSYDVEKVTEITKILGFGVARTPALVMDGEVLASGRIPSLDEMKGLLGRKAS
ncbi:MAG: TM0996/MTH895 family glutaredoxin-like protein [Bryobacterales bacterium]|nr:TM0996/MTH895 family glutaredoxin-like protein [Bryobacterales bacterium]